MPRYRKEADSPYPPAADDATIRIMDGLRRIVRALSTSARRSPGSGRVSGAQAFLLRQIASAPGLSLGELASRALARQSTVSEVVTGLVARGLVTRRKNPSDGRQTTLLLTARGLRAIDRMGPTVQERLSQGLSGLAADQRAVLAATLEAWLGAAGLIDVPPTMFFEPSGLGPQGADSEHRP